MKPYWEEIGDWLADREVLATPAELIGLLTGVVAGGARPGPKALGRLVAAHLDQSEPFAAEDMAILLNCQQALLADLSDEAFNFDLVLAEDGGIRAQIDDLAAWCQGFLTGIGTALKAVSEQSLPETVREVLADLVDIAQIDPDAVEEGAEFDLMQITEYLRVAVVMVFEEFDTERMESTGNE